MRFLRNRTISETFYLPALNLTAKLSPILLLYLWWVSPSINKRNKQVKHGSEFTESILTIFLLVFTHERTYYKCF